MLKLLPRAQRALERIAKSNAALHEQIEHEFGKIAREPMFGKPLRYGLKNQRRVHIGSFVLTYAVADKEIWITDFDHHDKIYKKRG